MAKISVVQWGTKHGHARGWLERLLESKEIIFQGIYEPDEKRQNQLIESEDKIWKDLNWLEDVHMGYEENRPAVFDRNINGWVTVPEDIDLPDNQQDRDMIARELLIKFQMSPRHPLVDLRNAYAKF